MAHWRRKAKVLFAESMPEVDFASFATPYLLWFELRSAFEHAYDRQPRDEVLIERIYQYADWCMTRDRCKHAGNDLSTATVVCFVEHIPQHPAALMDMPRWWRVEHVNQDRSIFQWHLSEEEFRFMVALLRSQSHRYDPRRRNLPANFSV